MMSNKRTQGWQRVFAVTVGSLLSVALFALLCWVVNGTDLKYQRNLMGFYVGVAWVVMTIFLLRKQLSTIPKKDNYRFVAYLFFGLSIGCGLVVIDQYVHRATSSYLHCQTITRESIGDAEYIMSEQEIDVMDNCRGYDVSSQRRRRGGVALTAYVVAPIRDSHGVYLAFKEREYYKTRWKSSEEIEEADGDARARLRERVFAHLYDNQVHTYRRIFAYNRAKYDKYVNAVENSSQYINDPLYQVESLPPIIEEIHDLGLGADARPNVLFTALCLVIHFFICVALLMAGSKD
ncbi:MAG: hypothetical protein IJV05_02160 [Muribaculaceae bacterium]|nr:hypothetical protein [Muribaculaceae bacterium]